MEFKVIDKTNEGIAFLVLAYIFGVGIVGISLCLVCKAIRKGLRQRHLRRKHRHEKKGKLFNRSLRSDNGANTEV